jgi:hypothetical protein
MQLLSKDNIDRQKGTMRCHGYIASRRLITRHRWCMRNSAMRVMNHPYEYAQMQQLLGCS